MSAIAMRLRHKHSRKACRVRSPRPTGRDAHRHARVQGRRAHRGNRRESLATPAVLSESGNTPNSLSQGSRSWDEPPTESWFAELLTRRSVVTLDTAVP